MNNVVADDGSLSFLKLRRKETNRQFNCEKVNQQKLVNTTFWIVDFVGHIKTQWGEDQYIVKIKKNLEDPESEAKKFFTGSQADEDAQAHQENLLPGGHRSECPGHRRQGLQDAHSLVARLGEVQRFGVSVE